MASTATGPMGSAFSALGRGFANSEWTGPGSTYEPAGVVHAGEYVISKRAAETLGVGNLDALYAAERSGYSGRGLVGRGVAGRAERGFWVALRGRGRSISRHPSR